MSSVICRSSSSSFSEEGGGQPVEFFAAFGQQLGCGLRGFVEDASHLLVDQLHGVFAELSLFVDFPSQEGIIFGGL